MIQDDTYQKDSIDISSLTKENPYLLRRGDSLSLLRSLPTSSVDALITDPPYSSGGAFRGDRTDNTTKKYVLTQVETARPDFSGDNRDQRSFGYWMALWLSEALRVTKPGSPIVLFSDWRQLPTMTDSLQAGGFVWRGLAVWDKTESARPSLGRFRSQSEFIVWGSNGPLSDDRGVGCLPGVFRQIVKQDDKHHMTGKPTPLMREIVKICTPGGIILDPFAGSFTTGVAAILEGYKAIGFETEAAYLETSARRADNAIDVKRGITGALARFQATEGPISDQPQGSLFGKA